MSGSWARTSNPHMYMHTGMFTYTFMCLHTCILTCTHTHTHRHAHLYTHVHRHTYTLSYIHMCTQACSPIHSSINTHKDLTSAETLTAHFHLVPCAWLSAAGGDCWPSTHVHQRCKRSSIGSVLQSKENAILVTQGPQVLGCPLTHIC